MLDDPVLAEVVVADRVILRFGTTDVVLADRFDLDVDGVGHRLDPARPETLGPLLTVYPATARWLYASPDGGLVLVLQQGQRLVVPGPAVRRSWVVGPGDVGGWTEAAGGSPVEAHDDGGVRRGGAPPGR